MVIYYGYAQGSRPEMRDGVEVSAPWARITVDVRNTASPTVEVIAKNAPSLGLQGVRPVMRKDVPDMNARRNWNCWTF